MDIVDECDLNEVEFVTQREYVKHIWFEDPITNSEIFDKICGTNLVYLTNKLNVAKNDAHVALLWEDIQKVFRNLPDEAVKCILTTFDEEVDNYGFDL